MPIMLLRAIIAAWCATSSECIRDTRARSKHENDYETRDDNDEDGNCELYLLTSSRFALIRRLSLTSVLLDSNLGHTTGICGHVTQGNRGPSWSLKVTFEPLQSLGFSPNTLERATRIELAFSAWEADVLPLNYARTGVHRNLANRCRTRRYVVGGSTTSSQGLTPFHVATFAGILRPNFGGGPCAQSWSCFAPNSIGVGPRGWLSHYW